jgi:soluble lytic murein transglycosylase-like protein
MRPESFGAVRAIPPKGAMGLMQIIPKHGPVCVGAGVSALIHTHLLRAPCKGAISQWEIDPPGNFRSGR